MRGCNPCIVQSIYILTVQTAAFNIDLAQRNDGDMQEEIWLPVPGLSKYEVSDFGRLRHSVRKWVRKFRITHDGYCWVNLTGMDGKERYYSAHGLVAATFIGPCPEGYEVNHENGQKTCNEPWNLKYVTRKQNIAHAHAMGLMRNNNGLRKLDPTAISKIIENRDKKSNTDLARQFNVCESHISRLRKRAGLLPVKPEKKLKPPRILKGRGIKLQSADIIRIRMLASARPVQRIADEYGINRSNVYQILRGDIWSHVR